MTRLDPTDGPRRGLRGAWWVALVVGLFFVVVAVMQIGEVIKSRSRESIGDGKDPTTYGFDLTSLTLPRPYLAAAMPKDTLAPLDTPPLLGPAGVDSLNHAERGKYLVGDDLVIGVRVGTATRAYPVRVMNWHEVANDTLGGVPIAVCWHPLSGSAVVLDRRHGADVVELGLSGLVWSSHHLLFDRRPGAAGESLWAPLLGTAVAGPAAGDSLVVIPSTLTNWSAWHAAYPATGVPLPDHDMRAAYKRDPYGNYASGDVIRFPTPDLPPLEDGRSWKDMLPPPTSAVAATRHHGFRFVLVAMDLVPPAPAD